MEPTNLKLWYNGSDWVVATSPEDAWKALEEETGLTRKDFGLTEEQARTEFWREWSAPLAMLEHEEQAWSEAPKKEPTVIVAEHGRGYLGSSDC